MSEATAPAITRRQQSDRSKAATKLATVAEWRSRREVEAVTPTGIRVRLRPPNIQRHALSGGLPSGLKRLATADDKVAVLNQVMASDDGDADAAALETRDYLDRVVVAMVVEPAISLEDIEEIPPVDYQWLVEVAFRNNDYDGEGHYLWGTEPLNRWAFFREEHRCDEDCAACGRIRAVVSALD